ncbi:MAG: TonB-dependent receptor plug domain-containing protein, partial [Ekhidna sp.]
MRALVTSTICLIAFTISAQSTKNSLVDVLKAYESTLSITFSYDPELINLISSDKVFEAEDFEVFKNQLENSLPFRVTQVDEKYYTIAAKETTYSLIVRDSIDNSLIGNGRMIQVLVDRTPITSTFQNGKWVFNYKPSIDNTLEIYNEGYVPSVIPLEVLLNETSLKIGLGLRTKYLNTVVIENYLTKGINLDPSEQKIKIKVNDLPLIPGETDGDIFASIAALPGITIPDGRAGNLFIRGSETDQSLILFDNIPVYHRGHYYGTISPYNPKVVKDVEVYRSGFHPRLGDRVGGAIIINSDQPSDDNIQKFGIGANTLFGTAYGKTVINKKLGFSFGARRSYSRKFESPKLEAISESVFAATALVDMRGKLTTKLDVLFEDYHGKITFIPSENHELNFTTIYTNTEVNYSPLADPSRARRNVENRFDNLGFNMDWKADISDKWTSTFSATLSDFQYRFNIADDGPPPNNFFSRNKLRDFNLKQEFSRRGKVTDFQLGVDYKWQEVTTDYQNVITSDSSIYSFQKVNQSNSLSPFMNLDFYGWDNWYFQIGFRSTYFSALNDFRIAPRFLVNYDLANWITLKGSTGVYNQYLSQVKNLEFGG